MSGQTNFIQVNETAANQYTDSTYDTYPLITGGITVNATLPSPYLNKKDYQFSTMIAALAAMLANKGFTTSDGSPSANPVTPSPSTAVSALASVLANILTTADYASIISNVFAGAAYSETANGYLKLPAVLGGLVIQWAKGTGVVPYPRPSGQTLSWPISFPTACLWSGAFTRYDSSDPYGFGVWQTEGDPSTQKTSVTVNFQSGGDLSTTVNTFPYVIGIGY
jgi:hypothetical protein